MYRLPLNMAKQKAPRNRSITLSTEEFEKFSKLLIKLESKAKLSSILNKTINQDVFEAMKYLPEKFIDLLFLDPPYNLTKSFNSVKFTKRSIEEYTEWIDNFISKVVPFLKPTASIYFCGDWRSSGSAHLVLSKYFNVRSRITWEREKGRGSKTNWKNNSEDIWFCTVSEDYVFNVDAVKLKKKVIAPYRDENGSPKDWKEDESGSFRLTHPSNLWTDISIPFWSMPENTEHPTQKPEKLLAKIILASTCKGQVVFDPFLGSGTTSVVAKKLNRKFIGIEIDEKYASIAEKRIDAAGRDKNIQGFHDGVFWERNMLTKMNFRKKK